MDMDRRDKLIAQIKSMVSDSVDFKKDPTDEYIENIITEIVFEKAKEYCLTVTEKQEIIKIIFNSMRRLDILQPLIEDRTITEIMINGTDNIFVEKNGRIIKLNISFQSQEKLENVIQSIISKVNRSINQASPTADARLSDGSRVSAVLPPIALNGPILTIRKFPEKPMTIEQLIEYDSLNCKTADVLSSMIKAKYNIFICGGTGSGKTTFLNALSNFIPCDERIITIEDSAELQIVNVPNIVRLETRDANTEGRGRITIRDLIKTSLRMRPDRIIVGEVRGPEALDMLQAMNTGHDGSLSTGHANSCEDMLSRLETMVLSGAVMPLDAIRQQIASAIDVIIHLGRLRDKTRRVLEIDEVLGYVGGEIQLSPLFKFIEKGETDDKKIIGELKRTENKMQNTLKFKMAGVFEEV